MQRLASSLVLLAILAAAASPALGQADAQQAYAQAKAAYQAGKWAEAQDLAQKAAQTDPKNPEVFLLLGQAQYQLGRVDEALAAWQQTLKLAPEEPYAKRMVEVLQGRRADAGGRIKLVEALLAERLYTEAVTECQELLREKALSQPQRAKATLHKAEALLELGKAPEALTEATGLAAMGPEQAADPDVVLLVAQAKVRIGGSGYAEGLAALTRLTADHAATPAGASARLELAALALEQGKNPGGRLEQWIRDYPKHARLKEARRLLIQAYLDASLRAIVPKDKLIEWDEKAIEQVRILWEEGVMPKDAEELTGRLVTHLDQCYAGHEQYAAALQGAELILQAADRGGSRRCQNLLAQAISRYQTAKFLKQVDEATQKGSATAPKDLEKLIGDVRTAQSRVFAFSDEPQRLDPFLKAEADLAAQLRSFSPRIPWPAKVRGMKWTDAAAYSAVLAMFSAAGQEAYPKEAEAQLQRGVKLIEDMATEYEGLKNLDQFDEDNVPLGLIGGLASVLSPADPSWPRVTTRLEQLLDARARLLFQEGQRRNFPDLNAKVSEVQKKLLDTLKRHVSQRAVDAPAVLALLQSHLKPWIDGGHWAVAEEMVTSLIPSLPEAARFQADLAVVHLWIERAMREHQRLAAAGLSVPRELDPVLKKALVRLYELQAGLDERGPELGQIRQAWGSIVLHYAGLEYYDVARQAVEVKPEKEKPVEVADAYAALQLARLADEAARRELDRFLKQYGATEKVALGPAFQAAIAAYTKFITDRPTSPLVPQAVAGVRGIGHRFEQLGAYKVASGVYGELAKFAAGVKVLSQSSPGTLSTAQQAALAAAGALDAEARKVLARQMKDRKKEDPPPAKLSDEYAAAIAAYKGLMAASPDSPLVGTSIAKIMAVALEYAKVDAWDVADGVYADLLGSKLAIRRPERLQFARGLCKLGQVMPDHARSVLQALTVGGLRESIGHVDPATLAAWGIRGGAWDDFSGRPGDKPDSDIGGGMPGGSSSPAPMGPPATPAEKPPARPPVAASTPAPGMPAIQAPAEGAISGLQRSEPPIAAEADQQLLAMIRQQESSRAAQVAQLRDNAYRYVANQPAQGQQAAQQKDQQQAPAAPVLSDAEIARQQKALDAAYGIFQGIRKEHPETTTAEQARAEILVMVGHWRTVAQWQRAAALAERYLADNPADVELAKIRLEVARDRLAWASKPIERKPSKQAMLVEVAGRFDAARKQLAGITTGFPRPEELTYRQQAQWEIAQSYLTQARVVDAFSPTLARGQYVRAAKELQHVAETYPDHPQIGQVPQMIWDISQELEGRRYWDEAILAWNELAIHYPMNALAQQAAMKVAQTYHQQLKRPLKASEAYQELNFARGGSDQNLQNAIFQIGTELKDQKRWVEALHVLEGFVESFPRHPQAGQALTMMGHIHQTNEAWKDAVAAYRRVIDEFQDGQWVQDAKWSIAECKINLSQWQEATAAYRAYVQAYPSDKPKVEEANRRMDVLKDLARYQALVDEKGQRKAFDAQFQIARIVRTQLANPVKAIIEYRKVAANWPESHLADDALYEVGTTYLSLGETEKAREALLSAAKKYPTSPLADDALYMVGKSYEDESVKLSAASRGKAVEVANEVAQRNAYRMAQSSRREQQQDRLQRVADLKKGGQSKLAEVEEASQAANYAQFNAANTMLFAQKAGQEVEALTATQLADRQDKINAALRKAIESYNSAAKVAGADKAGDALLRVATIYDQQLKDDKAAMQTWLEIVRQFSGTSVAEDASWRIAQYYERQQKHAEAIEAYKAFLRNYRSSPNAGQAQFAIAENYEHLGQWVSAMDTYTNYITNFPQGPLVNKAKEQINWIKTYRL